MIDSLFWWTGAVVCAAATLFVAWFVVFQWLIIGGANAVSFTLWAIRISKSFSWRKHWRSAIRELVKSSVRLCGHRNDGSRRFESARSEWHGIGHWKINGLAPAEWRKSRRAKEKRHD
jgi:hypothetical protein